MVVGQEESAGTQTDLLRLQQRLRDDQVRRRMRLPRRRMVLADPGLPVTQLIGPPQRLEIPLMTGVETPLRRVRWHGEQSKIHHEPPGVDGMNSRSSAALSGNITPLHARKVARRHALIDRMEGRG